MIKNAKKGKRLCLLAAMLLCLGVSYASYAKIRYVEAEESPQDATVSKNVTKEEAEKEAFERWSETKIPWTFSPETLELFDPPKNATIREMRNWANLLERPIPENTEKWGGFEKYRERVAYLKMDIADQICAANPDERTVALALGGKWFPYFILCKQDKTNLPKMAAYYEDLKSRNKKHGLKHDRFTSSLMHTRQAIVRDLMTFDEGGNTYLPLAESLMAELEEILEGTPLGGEVEDFYDVKYGLLLDLSKYDLMYHAMLMNFKENMRNVIATREDELKTSTLYFSFGPDADYHTPEGIAEHRKWLAHVSRKAETATDERERSQFHRIKGNVIENMLRNKAATEEEFLAHIKELEAIVEKDETQAKWYDHEIYNGYVTLFLREFDRLLQGKTVSDSELEHVFQSAERLLHAGESAYGPGTKPWMYMIQSLDEVLGKLTPEQLEYALKTLEELLVKGEKAVEERLAAKKRMDSTPELTVLRNFLKRRR